MAIVYHAIARPHGRGEGGVSPALLKSAAGKKSESIFERFTGGATEARPVIDYLRGTSVRGRMGVIERHVGAEECLDPEAVATKLAPFHVDMFHSQCLAVRCFDIVEEDVQCRQATFMEATLRRSVLFSEKDDAPGRGESDVVVGSEETEGLQKRRREDEAVHQVVFRNGETR